MKPLTKSTPTPDLRAINPHRDAPSSTVVIRPGTQDGLEWLKDVDSEPWQWRGDDLTLDPLAAAHILAQARKEGLTVEFGEPKGGEFTPDSKVTKRRYRFDEGRR